MKSLFAFVIALLSFSSAAAFAHTSAESERDTANMSAGNNYPVVLHQNTQNEAYSMAKQSSSSLYAGA